MKLIVNISPEDVYTFNNYYYSVSPTIKSALLRDRLIMALSPLVGGAFVAYVKDIPLKPAVLIFAILIVVFCIPFYVFYPKYHFSKFKKQIKKIYEESDNKSIFGTHEYHIEKDGLIEKTKFNTGKNNWESFEKVAEFQDNMYFFIGSMQAHIIPKKSVVEGDYEKFTKIAKDKIENS